MHTDLHTTTAMQTLHLQSPVALVNVVQGNTRQCRMGTHETIDHAAFCKQLSDSEIGIATSLPLICLAELGICYSGS